MAAEKNSQSMNEASFFVSLKLISIMQNGKSLYDYQTQCMIGIWIYEIIEQPLPQFTKRDLKTYKKDEALINKSTKVNNCILLGYGNKNNWNRICEGRLFWIEFVYFISYRNKSVFTIYI